MQLELGNQATPFARSGGSIGGELALCQRYYWRATPVITNYGPAYATNGAQIQLNNPVPMRTKGTSIDFSGLSLNDTVNAAINITSLSINAGSTPEFSLLLATITTPPLTQYRTYSIGGTYLGVSAEL